MFVMLAALTSARSGLVQPTGLLPRFAHSAAPRALRSRISAVETRRSADAAIDVGPSAAAANERDTDGGEELADGTSARGGQAKRWKRPRQHVNPLSARFQQPIELPADWDARAFGEPRPLHVDIGCAAGHFCVQLADARPDINVLGLEIREILVDRANGWADARECQNLRFLACNANIDLPTVLRASRSPLAAVSIQFADPWFKARHHKRRVVQPELVEHITTQLPPGGTLFVQSDVQALAEAMREQIELTAAGRLVPEAGPAGDGWLDHNPIGIPTEREIATARKGGGVWRALYRRA
jgi:tRNA (guanine-N7-)-methyltransferase